MKKYSIRKIVLSSICLFASLMLLVGLAFKVIAYDLGLGLSGAAGSAVSNALKSEVNGFDMLSFSLPEFLKTTIVTYMNESECGLFETLLGITSLLSLLASLGCIALTAFAFFRFDKKKQEKTLFLAMLVNLIIAVVHTVVAVIFCLNAQSYMEAFYEKFESNLGDIGGSAGSIIGSALGAVQGKFKTQAFITVIFQAVCFVAYIVCAKKLPETATETVDAAVQSQPKATQSKEETENKGEALRKMIGAEKEIVKLLSAYKALYDEQIISTADYVDKKAKLLRYSEVKIKNKLSALVAKSSFEDVAKAENGVIEIVKEYSALLKANVISDADFVEKKSVLLGCVIG